MKLPIELGLNLRTGVNEVTDLAAMPHLLIAGATGQGKSVAINSIILSLLKNVNPVNVKLVLIDPKRVELAVYEKVSKQYLLRYPDFEHSVLTETQEIIKVLHSMSLVMDRRYKMLKDAECRSLEEYNKKVSTDSLRSGGRTNILPNLVIVIDEFADLILSEKKKIENPVQRLAQLGRAAGIHLVIATQRPEAKVLTGLIKANIPSRISFRVASRIDSRIILDESGAEALTRKGEMLFKPHGLDIKKIRGLNVSYSEIEQVCLNISKKSALKQQILPRISTEE